MEGPSADTAIAIAKAVREFSEASNKSEGEVRMLGFVREHLVPFLPDLHQVAAAAAERNPPSFWHKGSSLF